MKIGIDIRTLSFRRGGISQYTYHLLKSLFRMDSTNKYFVFNYNKSPYELSRSQGNVREIVLRFPQRNGGKRLWEAALVPYAAWKYDLDAWFSPDFHVPRFITIPKSLVLLPVKAAMFPLSF